MVFPSTKRARLAAAVASAVDAVGGIRRCGGGGIPVATQYAGGRILGVGMGDDEVVVHVVVERLPLIAVVDEVHRAAVQALRDAGDSRPVNLTVDDLDVTVLPPVTPR